MTQNFGQTLKKIRESRGISLEEIAQKTHIRIEYLQGIEADEDEFLPSQTHKRGFLRLYAGELGIEIDELQAERYHLVQETPENRPKLVEEPDTEQPSEIGASLSIGDESKSEDPKDDTLSSLTDTIPTEQPVETENASIRKSALIFASIGEILRNQRELLSLSIDNISEYIHIQQNYLTFMEKGQFDQLPSPVQAKGMLANYVEFLNLDVDSIMLQFADGLQMKRMEKTQLSKQQGRRKAKEISSARLQVKNFFSLDLLVMIIIFIGFAAFVVWGVNRILAVNQAGTKSTQIPEVADILLSGETEVMTPQLSATSILEDDLQGTEISEQEEQTPIFTMAANNNPINILIIPRQQAWVQITSDSELMFEGRLIPGNAYAYSGSESVEVRTGNAGALQIYYNEQDVGSLGLVGQVLNLIFTEDGLILPTPANTSTPEPVQASPTPSVTPSPTRTPIPTDTLQPTATPTQVND